MAFCSRRKNISVEYWVLDFRHAQKAFHSLLPSILAFVALPPPPTSFFFFWWAFTRLHFRGRSCWESFSRDLRITFFFSPCHNFFSLFYGILDWNMVWFERFLLHKLDVKLSLPVKTDDITISKTRDVDPQRCLVTGGSGANGLKMKGFRWNSWDCNTTWYPLFNGLLLFTVGLSIIQLRFDCMTIFLC